MNASGLAEGGGIGIVHAQHGWCVHTELITRTYIHPVQMVGPTYAIALYQPGCGQQPWVALDWVLSSQDMSIDAYLAQHRYHADILGLKTYFNSVIDWIGSVFTRRPDKEMQGLDWGDGTASITKNHTTPP